MHRTRFRRSTRTRLLRALVIVITGILLVDLFSLILTRQHHSKSKPIPNVHGQRIFIASIHWNNEKILRSHWNNAVVELVKYFGPENVYVSVHESGSWDDSKGALRELDAELKNLRVNRTVSLDETTHDDEIHKPPTTGWIETPRGRTELRRIPYLARLRNQSLKPLEDLAAEGVKFDKVLFLNDVVFTTNDIALLLATRDGDYAAACSLDFSKPDEFYDTFALRDDEGSETASSSWPYFRSPSSRAAMISGHPVPVTSCWNGVVAFSAEPFYDEVDPLRFRGVSDGLAKQHLEGSECCLIHADNPLSSSHGVWLNPDVRVGYNPAAYEGVHEYKTSVVGTESSSGSEGTKKEEVVLGTAWPPPWSMASIGGIWKTRLASWVTTGYFKRWVVDRRVQKWMQEDVSGRKEKGSMCLINEMQVLITNGWAHV